MAKKEKVRYIDDGRTIADMSNVQTGSRLFKTDPYRPKPKFKEVWKTYWSAVRLMFKPMLVVVGAMTIVYILFYILLHFFA